MSTPIISVKYIDSNKLTFFGAIIEVSEKDTNWGNRSFYIIRNMDPTPKIIDVQTLIQTQTGSFDKNKGVIIFLPKDITDLKEIHTSGLDTYLKVQRNFSTMHKIGRNFYVIGDAPRNTISGTDEKDNLKGGSGLDILYGKSGDDRLHGGNNNDEIHGDAGKDTLYGNEDNDILYGGDDNDVLVGGKGDDLLYGGNGHDTYYFDKDWGNDTIVDRSGNTKIIFKMPSLETLTVKAPRGKTKINGDILTIADTKENSSNSVKIMRWRSVSKNFSFYSSTGQKYNLVSNGENTYKFVLASK